MFKMRIRRQVFEESYDDHDSDRPARRTAQAAREAGLLTPAALEQLITDAIRRQAGRRLIDLAAQIHEAGIEEMSMDEITAEVKAVRAERRARAAAGQ
jgi:hypothetical protein